MLETPAQSDREPEFFEVVFGQVPSPKRNPKKRASKSKEIIRDKLTCRDQQRDVAAWMDIGPLQS